MFHACVFPIATECMCIVMSTSFRCTLLSGEAYNLLVGPISTPTSLPYPTHSQDPNIVWRRVRDAVTEVLYSKEDVLIKSVANYKNRHNFFEMMRFDLILDDRLNVYLMEANMSPNLSSAHFRQNRVLYRQVRDI